MKGYSKLLGRTVLGVSLMCGGAGVAYAQTVPPGEAPPAASAPDGTADATADTAPAADSGSEIVVTGSRIARKDYTADSPILTVGSDQLSKSGTPTLEGALNQLPQFQPSAGPAQAFPPRGGQANINLRGLGANRSLVLLDGRRVVPANPDGTVDINILPQQLVGNVETITGGASTAYGSDAMAGVVNFRLRQNFDGVQLYGQTGITDKGDAGTYDISGIAGTSFADGRGHVAIFGGYAKRNIATRADRDFFQRGGSSNLIFLPMGVADLSPAPPTQAAVNSVFGSYGYAPGTVTGRAFSFNQDGTLFTQANNPVANYRGQTSTDIRFLNNSALFNTGATYAIQIPLERYSTYGQASFKVSDAFEPYVNALYTHYTANVQYGPALVGGKGKAQLVSANNVFIPSDLKALLNSRANPNAPFLFRSGTIMFGPLQQLQDYNVYQVTAGVRGDIPGTSVSYDVYASHGETKSQETFHNGLDFVHLDQLLRAADGGQSICAGGYNPFGENLPSQQCVDYLKVDGVNNQTIKQTVVEGSLTGTLFSVPAGDVSFAAGAQYRRNSYSLVADPRLEQGNIIGFGVIGSGAGADTVKELFGELLVPVIHNTPLIEQLNLDLAARYSDYDSVGGVWTYKGSFDWTVFSPLKLRGGYSRAVRAPSLQDLFGAPTTASVQIGLPLSGGKPVFAGDPCDVRGAYRANAGSDAGAIRSLCIAQGVSAAAVDSFQYNNVTVFALNRGNPNLQEEKADTFSIGAVLTSPFASPILSGLSASVDFYSIKISNAVGSIDLATSLRRCFSKDSNPTFSPDNIYCQQLPRQGDGFIALASQPLLNLATFKTSGIDAQVDWRVGLTKGLDFNLNFAGTYVSRFLVQQLPGDPTLNYVGTTGPVSSEPVFPKFKSVTTATFRIDDTITVSGKWRHISAVKDFSVLSNPNTTIAGVPTYDYFDADLGFRVSDKYEFHLGVINIGDKEPTQVGTAVGNTDFSTYDVLGRRFYANVRVTF